MIDGLFFSQIEDFSSAFEILQRSASLSQDTFEAWNEVWETAVSSDSSNVLWSVLVNIGATIAGLSLIYMALTDIRESVEKQDWYRLASSFILPITVMIFLTNNGYLLAETAKAIRQLGTTQVQRIPNLTLGGLTFAEAQEEIRKSSAFSKELSALYAECNGLSGEELQNCWTEKSEQAGKIMEVVETEMKETPLKDFLKEVGERAVQNNLLYMLYNFEGYVKNRTLDTVKLVLYGLQWAFVNTMELSLLLSVLFFPISLGASLVNFRGRLIWANLVGVISLFGVQLAYNLIVGLISIVLVKTTGTLFSEVAFVLFLSIFSPILAVALAGGGGLALYHSTVQSISSVADSGISLSRFAVTMSRK